ncbi:MAG: NRAMP family divalent metal transporter [Bacteroidota bacterium]
MSSSNNRKSISSALLGSAFLMATSAIGPGFITQTTVFTEKLATSFGFVILCSIVLDIVVQLNMWRIISASGVRAQELANRFFRGSGHLLTILIVIGGLAFNVGNVAGAGLGIQVVAGTDLWLGVIISVIISLFVFWYKEAGSAMDLFTKILGFVMIALTGYIAFSSNPPVLEAMQHSILPQVTDTTAIVILVGGTVGGYISFAGAHRLLDAGISGPQNIGAVSRASVKGILLASAMRILLFLAALGIVVSGGILDKGNPAASVFQLAAGELGYRIFGVVLWSASITSVVGSAYTSVSFLRSLHAFFDRNHQVVITCFIIFSAVVFLLVGQPVKVLIVVGAINALILPLALAILLLASRQGNLMRHYHHPIWMFIAGWLVVIVMSIMCFKTITTDLSKLW